MPELPGTQPYSSFNFAEEKLDEAIKQELKRNNNKISPNFIDDLFDQSVQLHAQLGNCTRVCVLQLPTGHEVVGYAQVLDPKNDDPGIGTSIAAENAKEELWALCGAIAKLYI